ncbi:RNA polymerase sigma-70 factor (family 1) [Parabacteroides sp. PF5-5]|uniref:RNA polymerase sigma factor n=1 Tax=unclassified Parabacteroides TaxID=2649774 RepID=UPI00247544F9|nr:MULTISPECIES: RNA polymerase sigma-70 factor [unclassified Parabacteroides]MDH6305447.1 RNA polymerase sigma-70 factor (family 1) [Parabacteroides sp. PH5-39]MDH6316157.1 RNA polymerase sigma-70 factor (family 1) [Parabacteroides sp. PF5-13]MDH6320307.1 RNA polymerase sigma-70 factor (family 1) [Parabacteroides sp. PH5-13]MDH6324037.1 RNA polymerase sigma-70 factor (family 1) [Parabacteroides sp. PH5-8]MDH6327348.1 RNA polymerase sigma-70 factor (family 1) [Parabacteroides sp. PH5-41]
MNKENRFPEHIISQISEGDWSAFAQFYNTYYSLVFRSAYYYLKDKEGCREVVADVFLSVWQSRQKLKEVKNMPNYLYIATQHESNRYLKRISHHHISFDEIPIELEDNNSTSPENLIITQDMEKLLSQVVSSLPDKCRQVFLFVRQEGLSYQEIAEILSVKESTVRVQLKIAIEKITDNLKSHYPELFTFFLFFFSDL